MIGKTIDQKCMWKNECYFFLTVCSVSLQCPVLAQIITPPELKTSEASGQLNNVKVFEDFSENPLERGWHVFGDPQLFHWNSELRLMEVTWDSSKQNSYLCFPLSTIISRNDDFKLELDLTLLDIIGGVNPDKPSPMQVAFGFQNRSDAHSASFNRGTGQDSPNLVEFNYFPDTGYGPTIWPAVFSESSVMNFNGNQDFHIFELPLNQTLRFTLSFDSETQSVRSSMMLDGASFGPVTTAKISETMTPFGDNFTQFYLDTFAISTFSDQDLEPGPFASSILAHGFIDNITITFPPPPIQEEKFSIVQGKWNHRFQGRENWSYALERTRDFRTWEIVGDRVRGTGDILSIQDSGSVLSKSRYYRINAFPIPYNE